MTMFSSCPKTPDKYSPEKAAKKSQVHLFLSLSGVDILESKTKVCYKHVVVSLQHMVQWHVLTHPLSSLCSVFAVHMPFVHCLLLCPLAGFSQSVWLCGSTPCSRREPLLPVPEHEVCEYSQKQWLCSPCLGQMRHSGLGVGVNAWIFMNFAVPCVGLTYRWRLSSFQKAGAHCGSTRPDRGGTQTQGQFLSLTKN